MVTNDDGRPAAEPDLTPELIARASARIAGRIRTVPVTADVLSTSAGAPISFALEFMQHTGTFKARGALNFLSAHAEAGARAASGPEAHPSSAATEGLPEAGVTIASGGNAGVACAWAAQRTGTTATVFLPETAPPAKVERLRSYGADVRLHGAQYAEAAVACAEYAAGSGALMSHAYDHPLIMAGAGTLVEEILTARPETTVIAVSVGGGGLFAGVTTAAHARGVRTIAVEPERCRALNAALQAGEPVDVGVDSVAADSLGARRIAARALAAAQETAATSVLVPDSAIVEARRRLWADHRVVVEHAAAAALAGVAGPVAEEVPEERTMSPAISADDRVCVVLCGANTGLDGLS